MCVCTKELCSVKGRVSTRVVRLFVSVKMARLAELHAMKGGSFGKVNFNPQNHDCKISEKLSVQTFNIRNARLEGKYCRTR